MNDKAIDQIKWLQYVFADQWRSLKTYAAKKGVTLLGDMPFYVSYDSVDVWANRELFNLDKKGNIAGIAGVPPDHFSAEGQLWSMPTFDWPQQESSGYQWWVQRVRKNAEYFDLIRLDHFRAFSAYWEVPAGEPTAVNGNWMPGPAADLFERFKKEFIKLPFVAEDLGDIDDEVLKLRDQYDLPGMRVLQFAFGADGAASDHIPHNHVRNCFAYTGTHDNNTTLGWYIDEADEIVREAVSAYAGQQVSELTINDTLIRLCYASVAKVVIIQIQDILRLDGKSRMNTPGTALGNWTWRISRGQLSSIQTDQLKNLTLTYNR